MELLEREGPLAALSQAREQAAKGQGSVVLVTGEPGIGKTALMARFAQDHADHGRILWGNCDDLAIPRPLGPFRDLGASIALDQDHGSPHRFHTILLEELAAPPQPTVLVLEDVHWADQATIDAITVIGRRIATLPAVLVLTYRSGELDPGHPLPRALETIRANVSLYLQLVPLSRSAVAHLAGQDADRAYAVTGGNPFYVTELLAARPAELPPSVANAVLGRASRLGENSRRLVELVSMVPSRVPAHILDMVMPDWPSAAEEPERRQLLTVDPHYVRFRHELARAAIRSSVPAARRRSLHVEILEALLARGADPAEIVHHAEAAGNTEAVASYALVAARRAGAVESNREAYAHYVRASDFVDRLPPTEQATLYEELAIAAYKVDRLPEALTAIRRAIELNREVGDQRGVGRCTRILSRCHWYVGDGEVAKRYADEAIEILEPLGESVELARAYSGLSQLAMLSADTEGAVKWGKRAVELADRLGADAVKAHALVNIGSVHVQTDPDDISTLMEAYHLADKVGIVMRRFGRSSTWVTPP
ncbi:MAG: ATP-binding protein [Acidimicrobiales bacterium]